jgi:glycine oxidase
VTSPSVLVIGGGVVGRSIGYHLARRGARVDVIDAGNGLSETSRASLGILTHPNGSDNPFAELYRDGHHGYAHLAEQIRLESGIDIGWRPVGGLDLNFSAADEEAAAEARTFNLSRDCHAEWLEAAQVRQLEPRVTERVRSGLFFRDDHRVDPEKLATGLTATMKLHGGRLFTGERLETVIRADDRGIEVQTSTQRRGADFLVLAAGCWTQGIGVGMQAAIAVRPVRGQHGRFDCSTPHDTAHILRYDGLQSVPGSGQMLVGATTDETGFDASTTTAARLHFEGYWKQVFTQSAQLLQQRAGLRPKPRGGRPMIGPLPGHSRVLVATGHYKNGILLGPISGQLIAEWIVDGRPSRTMERFAVRS